MNICNCSCGADRTDLGRGTTPPIYIDLPAGLVWSDVAELWVTVSQAGIEVTTKTLDDIETEVIGTITEHFIKLTQEETLKLNEYIPVDVQARMADHYGNAFKSDVLTVHAGKILKDGVIT